jgi:catechol 2,3-dioxygenase-like lactoylglutathione lyase family enzyme
MPQQSVHDLIVRQHHTAVSCNDWDKMKSFFVDLLGFKILGEMENRNEADLSKVTGMPGAACRWAMLELGGYHIELFKWLTPEGKPVPIRQCDHGPPTSASKSGTRRRRTGAWSRPATSRCRRCSRCAADAPSRSTAAAPRG